MTVSKTISVRQVMNAAPIRLAPDRPVQEAIELMNQHRAGAVLVVADEKLVGIFTERDFLRRAVLASPGWRSIPIGEWMSPNPYSIHPDEGWEQAISSLERLHVRRLPVVEDGKVVGILSDRHLIAWRAEHLKSTVAARTRDLRQANEQLLSRDAEMSHYMKAAARLQRRVMLPQAPPAWPEVSIGVHYSPLDPLGGDYYDFALPDPDHLGILIADASGHGIPAAMVAIMTHFAFVEIAPKTLSPGEVLTSLNARLQDLADERFVTAFYGVFNRRTRRFTYANAGHPFPYRWSHSLRKSHQVSARGFLLGITPDEVYHEKSFDLEPGDRLCLYTDGVADTRNDRGESFGADRLADLLLFLPEEEPIASSLSRFTQALATFRGSEPPIDDVSLILAQIN